jgi:Cu-processing system ATP-binding protein
MTVELFDVHKAYGGRAILKGTSLAIGSGEAVALIGANGCGKTTTVRCIAGLRRFDRGQIRVGEMDPLTSPRAVRSLLSYLPQRMDFPQTLTVREILQMTARLRGLSDAPVERELSLCGLTKLASRTVSTLSGGERQRVALAVFFMPAVPVYLLDEPTASLDVVSARQLADRLSALRDAGCALLFTTHVAADLDKLATRTVVLRDGRIAAAAGSLISSLEDLYQEESRAMPVLDDDDCHRVVRRLWPGWTRAAAARPR